MERSTELEAFVTAWFDAATRGDASLVHRHVSSNAMARLVGSDPDESFRGGADIMAFLLGEVEGAGGTARFTPSDTEASVEGTVGWAATNLTITLPDGRQVSPRWTAVLHQEDEVWKFVQIHASIGVRNDEVGWVYPRGS